MRNERSLPWTLAALVEQLATAERDSGLVLVAGDRGRRFVSWRALHRDALRLARGLALRGVRPGNRALLCLEQEQRSLVAFLALVRLGAVPCLVPAPLVGQGEEARAEVLARLHAVSAADHVVVQTALTPLLADAGTIPRDARIDLESVLARRAGPRLALPPLEAFDPEQVAVVQFSSGSTSQPKGVQLTHRNLEANVRLVVESGGRRAGDALATWVPLSHDMGFVGTFLSSVLVKAREHVMLDPWLFLLRPLLWLRELSRTRAAVSACPSFALEHCVERLRARPAAADGLDLSRLESLLVGAETVHAGTVRRFLDAFEPFGLRTSAVRPVYGLAEATLIVTAHPRGVPLETRIVEGRETVSVGRPLGDFALRVVGPTGAPRAPLEVGEIEVRGRSIMRGYLGEPRRDARAWLATGDLGMLDERGRLFVTGRIKDLMTVGGRNFYAHDVERALRELPFLKPGRAHAFARDRGSRSRVVVLAVPRGRTGRDPRRGDAVKRHVLSRCGLLVDDVLFVPRVPRTASGKIARGACERLAAAHDESAVC